MVATKINNSDDHDDDDDDRSKTMQDLQHEISRLQEENAKLRSQIIMDHTNSSSSADHAAKKEDTVRPQQSIASHTASPKELDTSVISMNGLSRDQIERYSRQLLLAEGFGVAGQLKLLSSSVLVVGAGGIGSTVLLYLGASGIGRIRIIDFDNVEMSNLHRQVIHKAKNVGMNKAVSACLAVKELNPSIDCQPLPVMLTHENALDIVREYDCIIDASDNPRTRYLINDACVLAGNKPLISGSAIGTEGQLSVYNWKGGPCYRCLYPKPSITTGAKSCSDNGVLGPVPGMIGILQSLEALKVLTDTGSSMNDRLLMYDSLQCSFLNIKKPPKQSSCPVCSENATIKSMSDSDKDLQSTRGPATCGMYVPSPLDNVYQISCQDYYTTIHKTKQPHVLLDVRVKEQYNLCSIEEAVNIPLATLEDNLTMVETLSNGWVKPIYCLCRRGVLSVEATKILNTHMMKDGDKTIVPARNIKGGLEAWRTQVDELFPNY